MWSPVSHEALQETALQSAVFFLNNYLLITLALHQVVVILIRLYTEHMDKNEYTLRSSRIARSPFLKSYTSILPSSNGERV